MVARLNDPDAVTFHVAEPVSAPPADSVSWPLTIGLASVSMLETVGTLAESPAKFEYLNGPDVGNDGCSP